MDRVIGMTRDRPTLGGVGALDGLGSKLRDGFVERVERAEIPSARLTTVPLKHARCGVAGSVANESVCLPGRQRNGRKRRPEIMSANRPSNGARLEKLLSLDACSLEVAAQLVG